VTSALERDAVRSPSPAGPITRPPGPVLSSIAASSLVTQRKLPAADDDVPTRAPGLTQVAVALAETTIELPRGAWDPAATAMGVPDAFGLLVLDGLVLREVLLAGVPTSQLVIPSEMVEPSTPDQSPLCGELVTWRVVEPTRVAVLGNRFLRAVQRHPRLLVALHRRHAAQLRRATRYAAIVHLPRVEQRVLTLMCALAEERGRVSADGITVALDLTHEHLGRLVGARRPTVSLALKALADDGLLRRRDDGWLIARDATHFADGFGLVSA
jgi:DNA-binding transcriptional ArsR family regulator